MISYLLSEHKVHNTQNKVMYTTGAFRKAHFVKTIRRIWKKCEIVTLLSNYDIITCFVTVIPLHYSVTPKVFQYFWRLYLLISNR